MSVNSRSHQEFLRHHATLEEIDATTSGITSLGAGGTAKLRYRRQGALAHVHVAIVFGTGGGGGAGTWSVALPSGWSAANVTGVYWMGPAVAGDGGTPYDCRAYVAPAGTSILFQALNVAGTYPTWVALNGTVPFTFGNGDFLSAHLTLELAT